MSTNCIRCIRATRTGSDLLCDECRTKERRPMRQTPTVQQLENRYVHHPPKNDQAERYAAIREKVLDTAKFIVDKTPCCPEQTRALNALDEAMFLANAAIARNE